MKIFFTLVVIFFSAFVVRAQHLNVVPMPNGVQFTNGTMRNGKSVNLVVKSDSLLSQANYLSGILTSIGKEVSVNKKSADVNVNFVVVPKKYSKEEYKVSVNNKGIQIEASTKEGVFRAISTVYQMFLSNPTELPCVEIVDKPRFEYRALMLDPARHFMPVGDVKRYIDEMARFKFNYLHMHLSDDQGWRVEIKKYPLLTKIGSVRAETDGNKKEHKGFYTQQELVELVNYAKERHIEIIPEIDVPGHSVAAIAAYPFLTCKDTTLNVRTTAGVSTDLLCAGNEKVFEMYTDIFNELCSIFPSKYFHLGGDEAPLDNWKTCPKCQSIKSKMGFKVDQELMGYFFERLGKVVANHGKTPLFWYELDVPKYPKNTITYAWRMGLTPAVIERSRELGYKVICAPGEHAYFDYPHKKGDHPVINWGMPLLSLKNVYELDPGYGLESDKQAHIMGVEATLWSECILDVDRAFYMTFPRAMALAEAGWSKMEVRNWDDFLIRIKPSIFDMISKGVNVRVPYEDFK